MITNVRRSFLRSVWYYCLILGKIIMSAIFFLKKKKTPPRKRPVGITFTCRHTDGQRRKCYQSLLATASRVRRKSIQLIALCFFYRVQNLAVKRTCLFFSMLLLLSSIRTLESTFCYIVWVDRTFDELSSPSAAPAPVALAYVAVPKALK